MTWLEFEDQADRIKAVESGEADFALVGTDLNYEVNKNPRYQGPCLRKRYSSGLLLLPRGGFLEMGQ